MDHRDKHAIPESMLEEVLASGWTHPWVLEDARRLASPVPYTHKSGAVTFVTLESDVAEAIRRQTTSSPSAKSSSSSPISEQPKAAAASPRATEPPKAASPSPSAPRRPHTSNGERLFCYRPEAAQAYGRPLSGKEFLIQAGSTAMREGKAKVKRDRDVRDNLVKRGILVPDTDTRLFRFAVDHVFSSPSQAAGVVKDGNVSGPSHWIDETTGKSLVDFS